MRWNLRLVAANRGVWKCKDLQALLAEHGLVASAGKMSNLWSGTPVSLKLKDLEIICRALDCRVGDLLDVEVDADPTAGTTGHWLVAQGERWRPKRW
ncbi:DNA-binding Xre family transcriptional regulator [Saccharothrix tamanrassetensis]|uniref:DNA-binding Xre family transcriptional regulator n=1 Tax=Saccharothrix tamanrassetensis TaxID=1051531 RepID=A0A841CEQ3_9PSEU|nr:helix-turn-helix transcriptional regulator [Saccharothrix tamanrassetensis]MBB5954216.1 DNA-binding Xre family transcriptional regulator [Saccharothrix tamanrassetensis]